MLFIATTGILKSQQHCFFVCWRFTSILSAAILSEPLCAWLCARWQLWAHVVQSLSRDPPAATSTIKTPFKHSALLTPLWPNRSFSKTTSYSARFYFPRCPARLYWALNCLQNLTNYNSKLLFTPSAPRFLNLSWTILLPELCHSKCHGSSLNWSVSTLSFFPSSFILVCQRSLA